VAVLRDVKGWFWHEGMVVAVLRDGCGSTEGCEDMVVAVLRDYLHWV
jgi:hypothetical protein